MKIHTKRILSILLALSLTAGMAACGLYHTGRRRHRAGLDDSGQDIKPTGDEWEFVSRSFWE